MPFSKHPIRREVEREAEPLARIDYHVFHLRKRNQYLKSAFSVFDAAQRRTDITRKEAAVDVFAHALLLRELVKKGIYPPKTEIILGQNKEGHPHVLVAMPDLGQKAMTGKEWGENTEKMQQKIALLKRHLKITGRDLHVDVGSIHNWRRHGDNFYYIDLEVLNQNSATEKLLDKYRQKARRLLAKKAKQAHL